MENATRSWKKTSFIYEKKNVNTSEYFSNFKKNSHFSNGIWNEAWSWKGTSFRYEYWMLIRRNIFIILQKTLISQTGFGMEHGVGKELHLDMNIGC
jgi:hypothetical protein